MDTRKLNLSAIGVKKSWKDIARTIINNCNINNTFRTFIVLCEKFQVHIFTKEPTIIKTNDKLLEICEEKRRLLLINFHKNTWGYIEDECKFEQTLSKINKECDKLNEVGEDIETLVDILKNIYDTDDKLKDMVFYDLKSYGDPEKVKREVFIASYSNIH